MGRNPILTVCMLSPAAATSGESVAESDTEKALLRSAFSGEDVALRLVI